MFFARLSVAIFRAMFVTIGLAACLAAGPAVAEDKPAPGRQVFTAVAAQRVLTLTGFTRARAKLKLVSETTGRCTQVLYDVGDTIGSAGVFAVLDSTFIKLDLESNQVEQARLKSRVAYLDKEASRYRKLVRKKSEAPSKLDHLEQDLAQASLQLKALGTRRKVLAERLIRHTIKAPPGWLVIKRQVEPGQWVSVGTSVAVLGDYRTLLVPLALDPRQYQLLKSASKPLAVFLPDQGLTLEAKLERQSPGFDPRTRKIAVDLELSRGLREHWGGLRVEFKLSVPDPSGAVLLPPAAVAERYQEQWLTTEDGKQLRVVLLGPGPGGTLRVSSPQVKAGMRFVASGVR